MSNKFERDWLKRVRNELYDHLAARGLELNRFCKQVCDFFDSSQDHYDRVLYRDAIARCLKLDIGRRADRDTIWTKVADQQWMTRKARARWVTGEMDTPPDKMKKYLMSLSCPAIRSMLDDLLDLVRPVRMGIARTLIYITVYPPVETGFQDIERGDPPNGLQPCWDMLRRHVHYRTPRIRPRKDLNQHALDCVHDECDGRFWIEPQDLGDVRRRIEADRSGNHPFFWSWMIFKYATMMNLATTNKSTKNPHRWIWDKEHPSYNEIWG